MFSTYTFLFFKLLLIIFMLLGSFDHARRVGKTLWMVEMEGMGRIWNLLCSKYVNHNGAKMIDLWNVNKLTAANLGLRLRNDEVGIIKRSRAVANV